MAGEVLRFPTMGNRPSPTPPPAPSLRSAPSFETFDVAASKRLLELVQEELDKSEQLFELVDNRRADAKVAGIESIAIEICALIEGGRLQAVADTLSESIGENVDAHVTTTGMDRVRRVEKLLSEANMGLTRIKTSGVAPSQLAAAMRASTPMDPAVYTWVPLVFFGLVVVGVIAVAVFAPVQRNK
jgi:hypothetical protein